MASKYQILVDAQVDVTKIQQQLDKAKLKVDLKDGSKGMSDLAKEATAVALSYQAANLVLRKSVEYISDMVDQVYTLDAAMVEFQKVSDLSGEALDNYVDRLAEMRDEVGRTTSELLNSAANFRKSGFNDEDSAQLAVVSSELQNIADSELSAADASNYIVSQLKAFNLTASDATHVVDALNEVSNNFAVSSSDLSVNIVKASAALATSNTTYEESLGLFTGIVEITRNGARASRGNESLSV